MPEAITYWVFALTAGRTEAFRIEDLMFSIVMLITTTMLDMTLEPIRRRSGFVVCWAILLSFGFFSWILWSASDFNTASRVIQGSFVLNPEGLRWTGVVVTIFAVISTLAIQAYLWLLPNDDSGNPQPWRVQVNQ